MLQKASLLNLRISLLLFFVITSCICIDSKAGLFIARNLNQFRNGAAQAARSFAQSFVDPYYLLHVSDNAHEQQNQQQNQQQEPLDILPNVPNAVHNAFGLATRAVSNTLRPVNDMRRDTIEQWQYMQQRLGDQVQELGRDLNDQVYINTNIMSDRFFRRLNRLTEKGALLAGGVALTSIIGWYGTKFVYTMLERRYAKPKIFQESSKKNFLQKLKEFVYKKETELPQLIFNPKTETELVTLSQSVKNINAKIVAGNPTARHRSVLLWGPPGTGKTAFASKLAHESGMDFESMSGVDIAKLDLKDALVTLDEIFEYAKRSKKGLILMVDEAEPLFARREGLKPDSPGYQILSKFLSLASDRTSGRCNKLMLILTTNHKEMLDAAFVDRIDESIEIKLPGHAERLAILKLYRQKYLFDNKYNSAEFVLSATEHLNDDRLEVITRQLRNFSGRGLESVMYTIKAQADAHEKGLVTAEIVDTVIRKALEKFIQFHQKPQPKQLPLVSPAAIDFLKVCQSKAG